jgi:hypothetical protein
MNERHDEDQPGLLAFDLPELESTQRLVLLDDADRHHEGDERHDQDDDHSLVVRPPADVWHLELRPIRYIALQKQHETEIQASRSSRRARPRCSAVNE